MNNMPESEIVTPLGFLSINISDHNDFTPEVFEKLLPLSRLNTGVDFRSFKSDKPFQGMPLVVRKSRGLEFSKEDDKESIEKIITAELFAITFVSIRWLEENKISGEMIFFYITKSLRWNFQIECGVFMPASNTQQLVEDNKS